jgi:hypothetical protein
MFLKGPRLKHIINDGLRRVTEASKITQLQTRALPFNGLALHHKSSSLMSRGEQGSSSTHQQAETQALIQADSHKVRSKTSCLGDFVGWPKEHCALDPCNSKLGSIEALSCLTFLLVSCSSPARMNSSRIKYTWQRSTAKKRSSQLPVSRMFMPQCACSKKESCDKESQSEVPCNLDPGSTPADASKAVQLGPRLR